MHARSRLLKRTWHVLPIGSYSRRPVLTPKRCFRCTSATSHSSARTLSTLRKSLEPRYRRKDVVDTSDTIYALSTAPGRAAIAVIRVSGPACLDIYGGLCPDKPFPHPRTATLRRLCDSDSIDDSNPRVLDSGALVLYFPAPRTVTGEAILEFHVHGGPAIVKSVLEAIPKCTNIWPRRKPAEYSTIRPAEPGEFTKRAFYNGRLDLTQAEALGEALAAETEQQRRLAVMGAESGIATRYEEWRQMLLYARGELEALIDFSEDQHFDESPVEFIASVTKQVQALQQQLSLHIANSSRGELLRNGISIALLGAPNAGKSSLLNRIVGREAAIVSSEAGTTRDIVDVSIDLNGWLCRIGDMAGLRKADTDRVDSALASAVGLIEKEGIRRARERALQSDVVLALVAVELDDQGLPFLTIDDELVDAVAECVSAYKHIVLIMTKTDLIASGSDHQALVSELQGTLLKKVPNLPITHIQAISCLSSRSATPEPDSDPGNIRSLLTHLTSVFSSLTAAQSTTSTTMTPSEAQSYYTASLSVTHRQATYLAQCQSHLLDFLASATSTTSHHIDGHEDLVGDAEIDIVTAAEHLRYAASCLAKITGKGEGGDVEDVLGVVFEK